MKLYCPECSKIMSENICTYPYVKSGLDNVSLENTTVQSCSCGVSFPSIYRIPLLNDKIAETLLQKPSLLNGKEIRFLRKRLFLPAKSFAKMLGVGTTTLSKWENDRQSHNEMNDRLIRTIYMVQKGFTPRKSKNITNYLRNLRLEKQIAEYIIVAQRVMNSYNVTLKQISGAQAVESFAVCIPKVFLHAGTNPPWTFANSLELGAIQQTITASKNETKTTEYAYGC